MINLGKKKKKKKKMSNEELSLLENIDFNIISQYKEIKEDIEDFQYQLARADRISRKKFKKAISKGKSFDYSNSPSILERKRIAKELEDKGTLDTIIKLFSDVGPVLKLLGRCVSVFILALLSMDFVKKSISTDTMSKLDTIFKMSMSI